MKMKQLLMTTIAIFGLAINSNAQVPNYVPSNGLVGWWPFNGNANDESLNGNNGTVNGATLTADRFGNTNKAYSFNGVDNFIYLASGAASSLNVIGDISVSFWLTTTQTSYFAVITFGDNIGIDGGFLFNNIVSGAPNNNPSKVSFWTSNDWISSETIWNNGQTTFICATMEAGIFKLYKDGILDTLISNQPVVSSYSGNRYFGINSQGNGAFLDGILDDIGYWNRALTQQEVTNLFNATNCANNTTINPQSNLLTTGNTATFTAITSDSFPSYVWQSDFGQGYVTLNNYGNYSGANTNSLSISNVQLANHVQPIRVISTSGDCIDTSNVATINITDTCIVTINDTITTLISVTDTLVINTLITGITPPNNLNTIKVFPNPANNHITIDYGNFASMNGYTLKISNSIGQIVFTTPINQQSSYVDLATWGGNGIYFVQVIDTQNNTIDNRKIVLQ